MKHVFIINPAAGKGDAEKIYMPMIKKITGIGEIDHEIHLSQPEGETIRFVDEYCKNQAQGKQLRFYACGGDGTLNEVASGVCGHDHAQVAVIPGGTGNDFIRNFTSPEYFGHIERQIRGEMMLIDTLDFQVDDAETKSGLVVNMCNIGLDSETAYRVQAFKKYPFVSGTTAYAAALASVLLGRLGTKIRIVFDEEEIAKGEYLLTAIGNGTSYGGGFQATPGAVLDDGLMDVCMIDKMSKPKLAPMIAKYKNGQHVQDAEIAKYLTYRKCRTLLLECDTPVKLCVDGEICLAQKVRLKANPKSLRFSVPVGCHFIQTDVQNFSGGPTEM